ncbi:hypothetical protein NR798_44665 [Archangium gephyra]|uniref:hypothetical protein n=1 Tax=Archangium gephyra TaxID=48 RepID=UPI0035D44DB1
MNSPAAWSFNSAGKPASQPQGPDPLADTGPEREEHQVQPPPLRAYSGSLSLLILGLSSLGCAIAALLGRLPPGKLGTGVLGAVYGVLGLTFCALSVPGWKRRSGSRGTLTLDREALLLTRGGEQLRFPLQALDFAVAVRPVLFGGTRQSLRLRAPEAQARVEQFTPKYEESGLDGFLELLAKRVAHAARQRLAQGELQGDGWRMDDQNLYHDGDTTPLSSIQALGWFSRRIAVWTSVDAPWRAKPVLDLDAEGFNAHVLALLAGRHLPPWKRVEDVESGRLRLDAKALPAGVSAAAQLELPLYGDAAGEQLYMERGKYAARIYVFFAFLLQAWIASFVCTTLITLPLVTLMPGDPASRFPPLVLLSLIGGGVLAWNTFRDRWKVIEAFSSRYCSGLANFSMLYVPLVAWGYANVRAVRKLSGR